MSNGQPSSQQGDFSQVSFNIFKIVIESWAASFAVLLHRNLGRRYLAQYAGGGLLLIPCYGFFCLGRDLGPLMWFYLIYAATFFVARINGIARRLRGETGHSFYSGESRLSRFLPRLGERTLKRFVEPALILGLGLLIGDRNWPLSLYCIAGAISLLLTVNDALMEEQRRVTDMHDALTEQQTIAERFRELRGQRWF